MISDRIRNRLRTLTSRRSTAKYQTPPTDPTAPTVRLESVSKQFGSVTALDSVHYAFDRETIYGVTGPNGSGKTTLFEIILRLRRPTAGVVTAPVPSDIGFSFQQPRFYGDLTVGENITVFARLAGHVESDWKELLVSELRLDKVAHRPARHLSGGFQKKLDIAIALLSKPDLVILDEPLSDVDALSRDRIIELLLAHVDDSGTVIISSHNHERVDPIVDTRIELHDGVLNDGVIK